MPPWVVVRQVSQWSVCTREEGQRFESSRSGPLLPVLHFGARAHRVSVPASQSAPRNLPQPFPPAPEPPSRPWASWACRWAGRRPGGCCGRCISLLCAARATPAPHAALGVDVVTAQPSYPQRRTCWLSLRWWPLLARSDSSCQSAKYKSTCTCTGSAAASPLPVPLPAHGRP